MNANFGAPLTQLVATVTHWARLFASLFLVVIVAVALAVTTRTVTNTVPGSFERINAIGRRQTVTIAAAAFALRG